jgi:hypothetical protein
MAGSWSWIFSFLFLTAWASCAPKSAGDQDIDGVVPQEQLLGVAAEGKRLFTICKTRHGNSGQGDSSLQAQGIIHKREDYPEMPPQNYFTEETGKAVAELTTKTSQIIGRVQHPSITCSSMT